MVNFTGDLHKTAFCLKVVVWACPIFWPSTLHIERCLPKVKVSPPLSTALNRTIQNLAARGQTIDDYNYENKEIGEIILEEIGDTKFDGISVSACLT